MKGKGLNHQAQEPGFHEWDSVINIVLIESLLFTLTPILNLED